MPSLNPESKHFRPRISRQAYQVAKVQSVKTAPVKSLEQWISEAIFEKAERERQYEVQQLSSLKDKLPNVA